jgi:hypothetical protein
MKKGFFLKGETYECCRTEGHCPLWFGRDLWDKPCVHLQAYLIKEGQVNGVDMKGIIILWHHDIIGPKFADVAAGHGIGEGAVYITDKATPEQRQALEPFVTTKMGFAPKFYGIKYVDIKITKENNTCHIVSPVSEQHITLTVGNDGSAIRMVNQKDPSISDVKFCNTELWSYSDYGKKIVFHNTEGVVCDFIMQGE